MGLKMSKLNMRDTDQFPELEQYRQKALNPKLSKQEQQEAYKYLTDYKAHCLKKSTKFNQPKIDAAIRFLENILEGQTEQAGWKEYLFLYIFLGLVLLWGASVVIHHLFSNYFG